MKNIYDQNIPTIKIKVKSEHSKAADDSKAFDTDYESPVVIMKEMSFLMDSHSSHKLKVEQKRKFPFFFKFILNKYVDLVAIIIFVLIFALNFHYIYLLRLEITVDSLIESRNFTNEEFIENELTESEPSSVNILRGVKSKLDDDFELKYSCFAKRGSRYEIFLTTIWFWIDLTVYSLLPFITMTICSVIITLKIRKINKKYKEYLTNESYKTNKNIYLSKLKKNRQIYIMLLNKDLYFLFIMVNKYFEFT